MKKLRSLVQRRDSTSKEPSSYRTLEISRKSQTIRILLHACLDQKDFGLASRETKALAQSSEKTMVYESKFRSISLAVYSRCRVMRNKAAG